VFLKHSWEQRNWFPFLLTFFLRSRRSIFFSQIQHSTFAKSSISLTISSGNSGLVLIGMMVILGCKYFIFCQFLTRCGCMAGVDLCRVGFLSFVKN